MVAMMKRRAQYVGPGRVVAEARRREMANRSWALQRDRERYQNAVEFGRWVKSELQWTRASTNSSVSVLSW